MRREHSYVELQHKLQMRACTEDLIVSVLQELIDQNLLSDARFTENYIQSRVAKGYGPVRIAGELAQRGINEEMCATYLNPHDENWLACAIKVRRKRFGATLAEDFVTRAREMRFLQYRGFTTEQIKQVYQTS